MSRITRFVLIVAPLLLNAALTFAQGEAASPKLSIGNVAPDFKSLKLLQRPAGTAEPDALNDAVVVLEFWATWCAPCIADIPHLNELTESFKGKPVRLISISLEDEPLVTEFMKRRGMKGWVAIDPSREIAKAYGVDYYPIAFVIDRGGKVAAVTEPKKVTEAMLNTLLAGKVLAAPAGSDPPAAAAPRPAPTTGGTPTRLSLSINPSASQDGSLSFRTGSFKGIGVRLRRALSVVYDMPEKRIVLPPALEGERWDIQATMAQGGKEELKLVVAKALEAALGVNVRRDVREMDVYALSAPDQTAVRLRSSSSPAPRTSEYERESEAKAMFAGSGASAARLAEQLSELLEVVVVDETGLKGKYAWDVIYDTRGDRMASLTAALRDELGLSLAPGKRKVEMLVAESK